MAVMFQKTIDSTPYEGQMTSKQSTKIKGFFIQIPVRIQEY